MRQIAALLLLLPQLTSFAQRKKPLPTTSLKAIDAARRLVFSSFNHAELGSDGTVGYILTDSSVEVIQTVLFDTTSTVLFSSPLRDARALFASIEAIRLDMLKDFYFNYCIMPTSGNEYFLTYTQGPTSKRITLHHYYLPQLEDVTQIINAQLPEKYRIHYLLAGTKQDCGL